MLHYQFSKFTVSSHIIFVLIVLLCPITINCDARGNCLGCRIYFIGLIVYVDCIEQCTLYLSAMSGAHALQNTWVIWELKDIAVRYVTVIDLCAYLLDPFFLASYLCPHAHADCRSSHLALMNVLYWHGLPCRETSSTRRLCRRCVSFRPWKTFGSTGPSCPSPGKTF
jgi:hypothetical protein